MGVPHPLMGLSLKHPNMSIFHGDTKPFASSVADVDEDFRAVAYGLRPEFLRLPAKITTKLEMQISSGASGDSTLL